MKGSVEKRLPLLVSDALKRLFLQVFVYMFVRGEEEEKGGREFIYKGGQVQLRRTRGRLDRRINPGCLGQTSGRLGVVVFREGTPRGFDTLAFLDCGPVGSSQPFYISFGAWRPARVAKRYVRVSFFFCNL